MNLRKLRWSALPLLLLCAVPLRAEEVIPGIVVNEILSNEDPPLEDAVELFNPIDQPVNIGGWFLSDSRTNFQKYRIPDGTVIAPNGYVVLLESMFKDAFKFSTSGDSVFLTAADAFGTPTGYTHGFSFEAAENGVSFGRIVNSIGQEFFVPQISRTLGAPNSGPKVGPVVISELMYSPPQNGDEYVELRNITTEAVRLYDISNPANTWKISGIGFLIPPNIEIPGKGQLLIVPLDPIAFRTKYSIPETVTILGPYTGNLKNSSEEIVLAKPGVPTVSASGATVVPEILVDAVTYSNAAPWPTTADGEGPSIERIDPEAFGNDPVNWRASAGENPDGTPGEPPKIDTDQDGIPDDIDSDNDNDGMSDADEMIAGTNRLDANSLVGGSSDCDSDALTDDNDADHDNDGVSDQNERLDGTSAYDAHIFVRKPLAIGKLKGAVRFTTPGTDHLQSSAQSLDWRPALIPRMRPKRKSRRRTIYFRARQEQQRAYAMGSLKIVSKKIRNPATGQFQFPGGNVNFTVILKKGPYVNTWSALGIDPLATKKSVPFEMPVQLSFFSRVYAGTGVALYTSAQLKGGKFVPMLAK